MFFAVPAIAQKGDAAHPFADKTNIVGVGAMAGSAIADAAQTCNFMATYQNFREIAAPFKTCAGVAFWISGTKLVSFAGMKAAHDAGHHRIERWIPWLNTGLNAAALIWNASGSKRGLKCRRQFGCG